MRLALAVSLAFSLSASAQALKTDDEKSLYAIGYLVGSRNFAPLFPFLDLAFGTFHMPRGQRPTFFGTIGTRVPDSFLGQLLFPFCRARRVPRS